VNAVIYSTTSKVKQTKRKEIRMKRVNCFNAARGSAVWAATILLAFGLNSATARPPHKPPPKYTVIDLGTVEGKSQAFVNGSQHCLNNRGQVVGSSTSDGLGDTPFIWQKGTLTPLPQFFGNHRTCAIAINEHGQVIGDGLDMPGLNPETHVVGALLQQGAWSYLPIPAGFDNARPWDINNRGTICGWVFKGLYFTSLEPVQPVVWRHGQVEFLPVLELDLDVPTIPAGLADAINDRDQIVGYSGDWPFDDQGNFRPPYYRATLWERGQVIDLSGPSGPVYGCSAANGINNVGMVVGNLMPDSNDPKIYGFVWTKRTGMVELPGTEALPFSEACAINDAGEIVGHAAPVFIPFSTALNRHAVLWKNGVMHDLNDNLAAGSEWILNDAWAINARGQIVAQGASAATGLTRVFLLDPKWGEHHEQPED
jgi:probable HAF family extracellular repeat protein